MIVDLSTLTPPQRQAAMLIDAYVLCVRMDLSFFLRSFGVGLTAIRERTAPPIGEHREHSSHYRIRGRVLTIHMANTRTEILISDTTHGGFDFFILSRHYLRNEYIGSRIGPITDLQSSLNHLHHLGLLSTADSAPYSNLLYATPTLLTAVDQWQRSQPNLF